MRRTGLAGVVESCAGGGAGAVRERGEGLARTTFLPCLDGFGENLPSRLSPTRARTIAGRIGSSGPRNAPAQEIRFWRVFKGFPGWHPATTCQIEVHRSGHPQRSRRCSALSENDRLSCVAGCCARPLAQPYRREAERQGCTARDLAAEGRGSRDGAGSSVRGSNTRPRPRQA